MSNSDFSCNSLLAKLGQQKKLIQMIAIETRVTPIHKCVIWPTGNVTIKKVMATTSHRVIRARGLSISSNSYFFLMAQQVRPMESMQAARLSALAMN
jgi:hypothetical protein